jgi:DNA-binding CsgD family transcriptional regulator
VLNDESELSERETEVLRLICQQKTAKEIGDIMFITQRTAEGHKNNLFAKTGAKNIAGLVIYAIQHNIIRVDELPII